MEWYEDVRRKFLYTFGPDPEVKVGETYISMASRTSKISVQEVDGIYTIELSKLGEGNKWVSKVIDEHNVKEVTSSIASGLEDSRGWS